MKIKLNHIIFILIISWCFYSVYAQEAGKIFTKTEANQKFGPVIQSFTMNNSELNSLLSTAGKYVMFNVKNGQLIILGQKRSVLYPKNEAVAASEVFKVYSTDMVTKLLNEGKGSTTTIEYRGNIISLTNGEYTLEEAMSCPPFCF